MRNRWDDLEAPTGETDLDTLAYAARLLGQEETLAPFEGSGASLKRIVRNLLDEAEEILFISPSRHLPGSLLVADLVPLRCKPLARLIGLDLRTPAKLANEVACSRTLATSAIPPIDAVLHAALPYRCVFETQPDAVLAIGCTPRGALHLDQLYAGAVLVLPYAASGLAMAKACAAALQDHAAEDLAGIIVLHQGLLTFGDSARLAYSRMVDLVTRAEQYLDEHRATVLQAPMASSQERRDSDSELPMLREAASAAAGRPLILALHADPASRSFCRRDDVAVLSQAGPVVAGQIRLAGRMPMLGRDVDAWQSSTEPPAGEEGAASSAAQHDAAPRIILDPDLGMCALGRDASEAALAGRQFRHAMEVVLCAIALEAYRGLPLGEALAAEASTRSEVAAICAPELMVFAGEIALVTGGASGIGKACVQSLLSRGAAVVNLDINQSVETLFDRPDYLGLHCDLTDEVAVLRSFETLTRTYGGLDMLVLNAGIFPSSCRIESLTLDHWQKVMRINLDSNLVVMRSAHALLKHSPRGGRVVVNASKNVLAPGAGAAAYSASKAAVTQLARVAALEWGKDHIRVNQVHPDAIFDTGIWTEDVLQARAAHYGMTVQQYKTRNVLGVELNSHVVGELVAEMLGPLFEKITGAQLPVDGGSDRVI
jgi:rhamnose utilization protein RhaD (predicted bifunctional aldolase and dehydrogenase)/NAD(P)-dependent dehydrogenase (short-subunit alcohol dehydrogenase family)